MAIPTSACSSSSSSRFVLPFPSVKSTASSAFAEIPINGVLSRARPQSQIIGPNRKCMAVTALASTAKVEQLNSTVDSLRRKLLSRLAPPAQLLADLLKKMVRNQQYSEVVSLYEETKTSLAWRNTHNLNFVMDCYDKLNDFESAFELFSMMKESAGCKPDAYTYNIVIDLRFRDGYISDAISYFSEIAHIKGFRPNARTIALCRTVIEEYRKALEEKFGKPEVSPEVLTYNAKIANELRSKRRGDPAAAAALYREMKAKGGKCKPDITTYNTMLAAFYKREDVAGMSKVLAEMQKQKCKRNADTYEVFYLPILIEKEIGKKQKLENLGLL